MPPAHRAANSGAGRPAGEILQAIENFLKSARQPALLEPGEELVPLSADNFILEIRSSHVILQAWDRTRNFTRRLTAINEASAGKLELTVERFARREGKLYLLDLARPSSADFGSRSHRLVFRERFRSFLSLQFPGWKLAEISAEADLEHSLSPAFPRASLRHGQQAWAAIACPPGTDAAAVVSFGLIWLAYLREREPRLVVEGLAIYVPGGAERAAALRLLCLDPAAASFTLFTYSEEGFVVAVDPRDHGNISTRLETCRRPARIEGGVFERLAALEGVESVARHDGRVSLRVRGLEFAEISDGQVRFGLGERRAAGDHHLGEIERLAGMLNQTRSADSPDRERPLYRLCPEAWLESQARAQIGVLDASLRAQPIYGQVPAFAAGERGIMDLLAVDQRGRLAVVELKATADLHLPLQALDYWVRVKWHLDRGEFAEHGYFPGVALIQEPPRLLLVAPALEFHPTTETILGFFAKQIEVERIGVSEDWRRGLRVMFRLSGAQRPHQA